MCLVAMCSDNTCPLQLFSSLLWSDGIKDAFYKDTAMHQYLMLVVVWMLTAFRETSLMDCGMPFTWSI